MDPTIDTATAMAITAISAVVGLHLAPFGERLLRRVPARVRRRDGR